MTNPHKMAVMLGMTKWQLLTQVDELLHQLYPEEIEIDLQDLFVEVCPCCNSNMELVDGEFRHVITQK